MNRDVNRLAVHTALVSLAWSMAGIFIAVFLLRAGLPLAHIFLAAAAICALRFALRPLVLLAAATIGLRATLILGTLLSALQFPALAYVHGIGIALVVFCVISAVSQVFYWTCYHAFFSSLGNIASRGKQLAFRQVLSAVAGMVGPAAGGVMLTNFSPWLAFGVAFIVQIGAIIPLLYVEEPRIVQPSPRGAFAAARVGIRLFFADGWIQTGSATAWSIVMFTSLSGRYDNFGGVLAAASLTGAIGGMVLGRLIDKGRARRWVPLYSFILAAGLILKSISGGHPVAVVAVAIATTLFNGLYVPYWMTEVYNAAKTAPCTFRFHFASEGGWDAGGFFAGVFAAAVCGAALPLETVILLGIPMVAVQAIWLDASYAARGHAGDIGLGH